MSRDSGTISPTRRSRRSSRRPVTSVNRSPRSLAASTALDHDRQAAALAIERRIVLAMSASGRRRRGRPANVRLGRRADPPRACYMLAYDGDIGVHDCMRRLFSFALALMTVAFAGRVLAQPSDYPARLVTIIA